MGTLILSRVMPRNGANKTRKRKKKRKKKEKQQRGPGEAAEGPRYVDLIAGHAERHLSPAVLLLQLSHRPAPRHNPITNFTRTVASPIALAPSCNLRSGVHWQDTLSKISETRPLLPRHHPITNFKHAISSPPARGPSCNLCSGVHCQAMT